ncbi:hypothetical protein [Dyadobacter psychrotolerans]|uniref:Outer membrane protein beta-barrel domain-containing protein n=1 Tax=Dyadobacter psychrotolerans TaxID=2541721 RepID=A0A4R5DPZ9_9BACT|nr:hypothetical protein [Dyadobacter psychrotolerans]TDE16416.1 hypothetical protein E0F88_09245 [Dyadobacter psychrotolerans]
MRKYFSFTFLLVCFICNNSFSQDLIVTNVGDSISCKIVKQTETSIHYSYIKYNLNTVREITREKIKSVVPGYFLATASLKVLAGDPEFEPLITDSLTTENTVEILIKASDPETSLAPDSLNSIQHRWQFGINGGYSYRLFRSKIGATPYELRYTDEIKSGYSVGAEMFYFPWNQVGFGVKYDIYKSKAERDIRTRDDIAIQFFGASVAYRMNIVDNKTILQTAFWAGYQPYKNAARHIGQDYKLDAQTMGWGVSLGVDRRISKSIALSLAGSCFISSAYKLQRDYKGRTETVNLARENFEDLSRAQITFGIKFLR